MILLDIRSVSLMIGINILVLGLCMLYYYFSRKTYQGFQDWTIGINLFGLALFTIAFRNLLPHFISIILANAMICLAFILFYRGFKIFAGNGFLWRIHILLFVLVSWILFPIFTYITPDVNHRISLISLTGALYFILCAKELMTNIQRNLFRFNRLLFSVLVGLALFLIIRGIFFQLPDHRINVYLSRGLFHGIFLILTNVLFIFYTVGLVQLNAQRLEKELEDENRRLTESEKRYRSLVEHSPLGVIIVKNPPLEVCFANQSLIDLTGYSAGEFSRSDPWILLNIIHPEDREMVLANLDARLKGSEQPAMYQVRLIERSGDLHWTEVYARQVQYKNTPAVQAIIVDTTEKKKLLDQAAQIEDNLKASLKEKKILLQEIHHRVKNNMQIVCSLISLQAEKIADANLMAQFTDTQARVQSMALIHNFLYKSENFSQISLQAYLEPLVEHLLDAYKYNTKTVQVDIRAHDILLKMDHAVPCGLIAVELISNTLKYAIPLGNDLIITIKADYVPDRHIKMKISDNGRKAIQAFKISNPETLGLQIVTEIICGQLEGTYQVDLSQGVAWTIKWAV